MKFDLEKLLEQLGQKSGPSQEFHQKLLSRLEKHSVLLNEQKLNKQKSSDRSSVKDNLSSKSFFRFGFFGFFQRRFASALIALLIVVSSGGLSAYAYTNENITPENPLYPLRRVIEKVEGNLTANNEERAEFRLKMARRRLLEAKALRAKQARRDALVQSSEKPSVKSDAKSSVRSSVESSLVDTLLEEASLEFEKSIESSANISEEARRERFFQLMEKTIIQEPGNIDLFVLLERRHKIFNEKKEDQKKALEKRRRIEHQLNKDGDAQVNGEKDESGVNEKDDGDRDDDDRDSNESDGNEEEGDDDQQKKNLNNPDAIRERIRQRLRLKLPSNFIPPPFSAETNLRFSSEIKIKLK